MNTHWAVLHVVLQRLSVDPVAGSSGTYGSVNTYWAFLQFHCAEPAAGSVVGSAKFEHLWGRLIVLLKLLLEEPTVGSAGTYIFWNTYRLFLHFYCIPRSAIIILNKDRGEGDFEYYKGGVRYSGLACSNNKPSSNSPPPPL